MNRKERRAAQKSTPAHLRESKDDIIRRLIKNGITPEDLKREREKGYEAGFREAAEPIVKGCMAAVCLALNDIHGFGRKRCKEMLQAIDEHMLYSLTSEEAINEVWKRMGLKIEFAETFDRIQEV